ncbi:MAG: tRNA (N(6)-L-threonylcarbamoyladenosine(37)-C(2))-methylthiotransferase MtaB [Syntrophobacteraceae bacterium]|nr:tRNA (N(6)-L-threonylcarbamoyladenosine(37)-C(2))-methylthiotransferase MtaB [Syntrophobacteraceae bacterium]
MVGETNGPTVAIETLGCKVNQFETSYLLEMLQQAGYRPVSFRERADVYIIHSCAVTAKAGSQTRQLLRRARRANPEARIVAAGCYAQLDGNRIAREGLATHVLGNPAKFDLLEWLGRPGSFEQPCVALTPDPRSITEFEVLPVSAMHTGRTRAVLKIQDGCNSFCSYCVVPHVRGNSRSLPSTLVLAQLQGLIKAGYREVVLTGIHLGKWGKDLSPAQSLPHLLESIAAGGPRPLRLRLSSIEPEEFDSRLLEVVSSAPWICPHFHIPLQSGDPLILARMGRPYSPQYYGELVARLHASIPGVAIGADVLTGFPGESEKQFENTLEFIEKLPLSYLHVFPFSPRPGAAAAEFPDQVQGDELKRRAAALQALGRRKRRAFRENLIGQCFDVLVEGKVGPNLWEGLSSNYVRVFFDPGKDFCPGKPVMVRVNGFRGEDLRATVIARQL